jgi:hypothetical protein
MTALDNSGRRVWHYFSISVRQAPSATEVSSLLRVMVMLEDAPIHFVAKLLPQHADICTRGWKLRAQLPSYLVRQRAAVVTHCPLPAVLRSFVAAYAVTTPEDMWAEGLRTQAPLAKRGRTKVDKEDDEAEGDEAPPLRRSLRLRQKRA